MSDPAAVDDLAQFLRGSGCVAVLRGATRLEVTPRVSLGDGGDRAHLTSLVEMWRADHGEIDVLTE